MPSDERIRLALAALVAEIRSFRSAVATAAEQVRSDLAEHAPGIGGHAGRVGAELGVFGAARIDVERLSSLFHDEKAISPQIVSVMQAAAKILSDLLERGDDAFVVEIPAGASVHREVARAIEGIGSVFSAVRAVERCKASPDRLPESSEIPGGLPFAAWSRTQRRLAPPLVVSVDGGDLHAGGLAELLDGGIKLVLVVRGEAPPASLVRLITPGTFVAQTTEKAALERLAAWSGAGVAALVAEPAALFVHDPVAGPRLSDRLVVSRMPEELPKRTLGGLSPAQQAEELLQLQVLATAESAAAHPAAATEGAATATAPAADPADRLAAWLIRQAGLDERG